MTVLTDRISLRAKEYVVLGAAGVVASGLPMVFPDPLSLKIGVGVAGTAAVFAAAFLARSLRESLLVLGVLSVFGWASALIFAAPAADAWLRTAPVPVAFLAVNATKLTSVVPLLVLGRRLGWSRRRFLVGFGDPRAAVARGVPWPPVAVLVLIVVAALFLLPLPHSAFGHLADLVPWLPVVLLGATVNAFSEELLYRHALIGSMRRVTGLAPAVAVSCAVFGLAHWSGTPGGPIGVAATAAYGLVCAAAMLHTRGMVWNVPIHIAGDVAAACALFLAA